MYSHIYKTDYWIILKIYIITHTTQHDLHATECVAGNQQSLHHIEYLRFELIFSAASYNSNSNNDFRASIFSQINIFHVSIWVLCQFLLSCRFCHHKSIISIIDYRQPLTNFQIQQSFVLPFDCYYLYKSRCIQCANATCCMLKRTHIAHIKAYKSMQFHANNHNAVFIADVVATKQYMLRPCSEAYWTECRSIQNAMCNGLLFAASSTFVWKRKISSSS